LPSTLAQKLNLKPDVVLEVTNVPANWAEQLAKDLPANPVKLSISEKPAAILLFIRTMKQLENLAFPVIPKLGTECIFWLVYPKGTSGVETDLNRDVFLEAG
jgi:hypothetical protein